MKLSAMSANTGRSDADLVFEASAGSRQAFGEIVGRYQSLVCALTYSATGSLCQSQESRAL